MRRRRRRNTAFKGMLWSSYENDGETQQRASLMFFSAQTSLEVKSPTEIFPNTHVYKKAGPVGGNKHVKYQRLTDYLCSEV